ncbi:hypothetical protein TNCV_626341 [Trichonephila clavipes]|nr:hypothetical protein TNCV_626341 [Trichonephila clavipes]
MFTAVIHYQERKLLSGIDMSEKAGKVSKTTNTLDCHRLPALQTSSGAAVHKNRLQTVAQIAKSVGIFDASYRWILTKDVNMHRVCQHIIPHMLKKAKRQFQWKWRKT